MPWTCPSCAVDLTDDLARCPTCGAVKEAWTLLADRTRTLQVSRGRSRLEARRGVGEQPVRSGDAVPAQDTVPAEVCPVLPKAALLALLARGLLPAPAQRLIARVWPRKQDRTVTLVVDLAARELLQHEAPGPEGELGAEGWFEVPFVCAYGPEDLSRVQAPGLHLVDVSDDTERGFADEVELHAVKKSLTLPTDAVRPPTPRVGLLEVEDLCFATGRAVLFPGGWSRADGVTGLSVIAAALQHARLHPSRRLLVAGHTDARGSVAFNTVLSANRAQNVHLYLTGQREAWAAHCQQQFEVADLQAILKWVDFTFEWGCDPGPVDGMWGSGSSAARDAFRARYDQEYGGSLGQGGEQSEADWAALFDLYDVELARKLKATPDKLAALRAGLRTCEPPTLACSEHWPTARPGAGGDDAANRRVDVLFFEEHDLPALPGEPPGAAIYGEGGYARDYLSVDDTFREVEPPYGDAPFAEVCLYASTHRV